jgi:hypothetical protein
VADKTPQQRMQETIAEATTHAQQSLDTYEKLTKAAIEHSLAKDEQADLTNDLMQVWAQNLRDAAYGWATWASLMADYAKAAPPATSPGDDPA